MPEVTTHRDSRATFAMRVADESCNKIIKRGWYALIRFVEVDDPRQYDEGALLFVERLRDGLSEKSIRRVERKTKRGCELACYSTLKRYQQDCARVPTRDEKVRVIGEIVGGSFDIEVTA